MSRRTQKKPTRKRSTTSISLTLKRWVLWSSVAIVGLFGFFGLFGKNGLFEILRLKAMHAQVDAENQKLLHQQEKLKKEIALLQDPQYLEFMAREELGMIGEREYFILLDESQDL